MIKPRGISKKIHFAGGMLSFIIVCVITLTVAMNERSKKDSFIINIAGKQRMLTQKMSKEIFYIKYKQSTDFRELNSAIDLFDNNLHDLIKGNSAKGIYLPQNTKIKTKLEEVNSLWISFKSEVVKIRKAVAFIKNDLETLTARITSLLSESDKVVKVMVKNSMSSEFIDLSGRQRMLSQRMGLFVERYLRTDNEEDYLQFVKAKNLYDETINMFMNHKEVKAIPEVLTRVEKTYKYWKAHEKYVLGILKVENSMNDSISYVHEKNIKLLNTMDEAVWLYTEHSEEKNSIFIKFQYISLVIALIIILFSYILSREIVNHINDFVNRTKALESDNINSLNHRHIRVDEESEDELIEASNYLSKFVKKVNVAMSHSEDAIKQAESAVHELQHLADNVNDALRDLQIDKKEKDSFDKKVNATEDIAIESAENLIHVRKMLEKLN
ncbi:MAG TPA: methyl-accepting chemotaxis protein [Sulfurimonas autotrophica]|nr:methyl-accepting chemotaxis protein [Sulfurimonas autotrophica]